MTHVLTVAGREFRERRMVFAGAAMVAAMPFLFALLPSASGTGRDVRILGTGGILAFCWAMGLAIVLGATFVSRELADRRLSFYLTKPVSAPALWFGKLFAAWAVVLASTAIVFGPSVLAGWQVWSQSWNIELRTFTMATIAVSLSAVLAFHAITTSVRSRSPLIAIDLAVCAVIAGAMWLLVQPLLARMSRDNAAYVAWIVTGGMILSLVPAGAWQIARGRSDIRASHAALSKFTWVAAPVVIALAASFVAWILSATPSDLESPYGSQAPTGKWAWLEGKDVHRNDYHPMFLIDIRSGSHVSVARSVVEPSFSRDGHSLVRSEAEGLIAAPNRWELVVSRLKGAKPRHIRTGITAGWFRGAVLSDDGRRVAAITGDGLLTVADVDSQRILGSANMTRVVYGCDLFFADENTVRIVERGVATDSITMRVLEFDVAARKLTRTGELTRRTKSMWWFANATGTRMLINVDNATNDGEGLMLVDGRTLQPITRRAVAGRRFASAILANGDVVLLESASPRVLQVMRSDGTDAHQIALPGSGPVWIAGEIEPSKLLIRLARETPQSRAQRTLLVLDVNTGRIQKQAEALTPTGQSNGSDPRSSPPNAPRPLLVRDESGFFTWNPLTGERKKLAS
jgi:hypothetical protein